MERTLQKPNNIVPLCTGLGIEFFKWWCTMLKPFIPLANRDVDVLVAFLYKRYRLSRGISDIRLLDVILMSNEVKREIREECGMSSVQFYGTLSRLKKARILVDNKINPRLIPNLRNDKDKYFQLLILFDLEGKDAGQKVDKESV